MRTGSIVHLVGARPNFVKLAGVLHAVPSGSAPTHRILHTGQHYDARMSERLFAALALPAPDWHLGIGGGSHAENTGRTVIALEPVLARERPRWLVLYGDVDATLAGALVGSKLGIPIAHVEAGVRSFDRSMPEELNRVVVDALADRCLAPTRGACANLEREGITRDRIRLVGNVMVDTVLRLRGAGAALDLRGRLGLNGVPHVVVTLHRPANVDRREPLTRLLEALRDLARDFVIVFPMHPRTRQRIEQFALGSRLDGIRVIEPLDYLELIGLVLTAAFVVTDSGGLQTETAALGVRCLTIRDTTEWEETIAAGLNRLVPADPTAIRHAVQDLAVQPVGSAMLPEGWDGGAGARVLGALDEEGW